jgi:hypothetical protein
MEVWLPWIEIFGLALLPSSFLWLAFRRKRAKQGWRVVTAQVTSVVAALPIWLFSLFLLTAQGCEEDQPLIGSPDGRHVARLMIWGSVPSGTSLRVIERRAWSPRWEEVAVAGYAATPIKPIQPKIVWSDNLHLVLDFPSRVSGDDAGFAYRCENKYVGDVLVICKTHETN